METPTKTKLDVYELITNRIIERLEAGIIPWQQPWTEAGLPQNLVTGKAYTGINVLLLASMGFARNFFLTFKQIKDLKKDDNGPITLDYLKIRTFKIDITRNNCSIEQHIPIFFDG